jgi:hypothetical protein
MQGLKAHHLSAFSARLKRLRKKWLNAFVSVPLCFGSEFALADFVVFLGFFDSRSVFSGSADTRLPQMAADGIGMSRDIRVRL